MEKMEIMGNPFLANVPILYPPENTRKPKVSGGIRWENWPEMG